MSHRVARAARGRRAAGWIELRRAEQPGAGARRSPRCRASRRYSRTSLLTGALEAGVATDEAACVRAARRLLAASRARRAAAAVPQGRRRRPARRSDAERATAIAGRAQVVGAVVNAIDDHLARSDQLATAWRCATSCRSALAARRGARRRTRRRAGLATTATCSSTATVLRSNDGVGGERWRAAAQPAGDGEVELARARACWPATGAACSPCDERSATGRASTATTAARTAQEVLAPLLVLAPALADGLDGWVEAAYDPPAWWTGESESRPSRPAPTAAGRRARRADRGARSGSSRSTRRRRRPPADLDRASCSRSDLFSAQRAAARRTPVPQERIAAILAALERARRAAAPRRARTRARNCRRCA